MVGGAEQPGGSMGAFCTLRRGREKGRRGMNAASPCFLSPALGRKMDDFLSSLYSLRDSYNRISLLRLEVENESSMGCKRPAELFFFFFGLHCFVFKIEILFTYNIIHAF